MKLIALECPKCNAQLEINTELTQATCNYCGCSFLIADEIERKNLDSENAYKVGYDFERGRYERQIEECQNLAKKVKELIDPVLGLQTKTNELNDISMQICCLLEKEKLLSSFSEKIKCYKVPLFLFITTLLLTMAGGAGIFVIGSIIAGISAYVTKHRQNKEKINISKQLQQKKQEYNNRKNEISYISSKYDFELIPERYRSKESMEYIYEVLYDQRAMNISQAINLYVDHQHKTKMENLQREQIAIQMQQAQQAQQTQASEQNTSNGFGLGSLLKAGGMFLAIASVINQLSDD